jgi:3-deoxy-D-manno-octulosonate 8-phosphate phosphatase (KDO 8-P phosphatase)
MIEDRIAKIELLVLDVDGVMTDGRIIVDDHGEEIKYFNVKDGHGLKLLMRAGIEVIIISGRKSRAVDYRAENLGIHEIYQGVEDKGSLFQKLVQRKKLTRDRVCAMGDDLPDLAVFNQSGVSIAVADAVPEVRDAASFITKNRGGDGAIREVCELILKAQKKWPDII